MSATWDHEIAALLDDLSVTQDDLLVLLAEKRELLRENNLDGLAALGGREGELMTRLQACHTRRGELLERAGSTGLPSDSIESLAAALPNRDAASKLAAEVAEAGHRSRLLQHQSLTNWVVVQRTLIHLSQLLEIIATGGQARPTYGKDSSAPAGGSLVDHAA